ncbi:MAG: outer membrane protein assembly factor BamA [Candidatus Omnitrophota bacterium]|jgi:outer membrane protein insertion porin family|nr:MAG: outer membrane protein assembly factor BamA [Candidatus Omnitrophota bacterium]
MKKRTHLVRMCLLAVFITAPFFAAFGQSDENAITQESSVVSTEATQAQESKMVTAMEVKGNKSISTNTVLSKMKIRIGSPYNDNIINDDLKRLYLLGYFSDISIDTEDYNNGVKVIIKVVERPVVEKITFQGIKRLTLREEKIKEELKIKESQYLDYPSLNDDIETLKKLYAKRGYSEVDIEYKVEVDDATNKARVRFEVSEGKRVRIKNIIVDGNSAFSDGRILRLMKTKRAWLFNAGTLKDDVFKEDIERVRAFYQRAGYLDVAVTYDIKKGTRKSLLYITITVQEGKKYLVGSLEIKGNQDISEKDILSKLKEATPGKVFSQEALKQDIANIQSLYFDRGYISMQIQEGISLNTYTGRVDIVYTIRENDITYVDKIKIRGNVKTKDLVIRRELRIKPGDRFDGDKLRRSKERLQNLGFFDEISYDTEDAASPEKKDLVVDVKETKTGAFSFGGGYSTVDEFIGFVEIEQKNFDWKNWPYFTGGGQVLKFRGQFGTVSSGFDLGFTEPWLFDYPVSFGFDIYKRTHKRETDIGYGYDEDITGGDLRLGKEISEYVRASATYRYDEIEITNISDDATNDLKSEYGKNTISSTELGLTYDTRDNVFDTRKGNLLSGSFQVAGGPFAGDKDFTKFYGRASHYFPLFKNAVLEARGRLGLADPYGGSSKVPIYERFFAGGAYSLRGYHERKIGPIDPVSKDPLGGESMILGNLEYTYPLMGFLKVATFYDTGNVWSKASDVGAGGFKSSTGIGFRIKTPIGPVSLDYGIPLNKEPGEEDKGSGRFHFSVSHGF